MVRRVLTKTIFLGLVFIYTNANQNGGKFMMPLTLVDVDEDNIIKKIGGKPEVKTS